MCSNAQGVLECPLRNKWFRMSMAKWMFENVHSEMDMVGCTLRNECLGMSIAKSMFVQVSKPMLFRRMSLAPSICWDLANEQTCCRSSMFNVCWWLSVCSFNIAIVVIRVMMLIVLYVYSFGIFLGLMFMVCCVPLMAASPHEASILATALWAVHRLASNMLVITILACIGQHKPTHTWAPPTHTCLASI
jgi:hypothetical protein